MFNNNKKSCKPLMTLIPQRKQESLGKHPLVGEGGGGTYPLGLKAATLKLAPLLVSPDSFCV